MLELLTSEQCCDNFDENYLNDRDNVLARMSGKQRKIVKGTRFLQMYERMCDESPLTRSMAHNIIQLQYFDEILDNKVLKTSLTPEKRKEHHMIASTKQRRSRLRLKQRRSRLRNM